MKKIVVIVSIYVFLIIAIFLAFNSEDVFAGSGTDKYTVERIFMDSPDNTFFGGADYTPLEIYKLTDTTNGSICYITYVSAYTLQMQCFSK